MTLWLNRSWWNESSTPVSSAASGLDGLPLLANSVTGRREVAPSSGHIDGKRTGFEMKIAFSDDI